MTEAVYTILSGLNRAGYEAYIVGGAVRDKLMHKEPHDYDITTSARPEEIVATARKEGWQCIESVGRSFGVSLILIGGQSYEVATFRDESYGEDSHRPEKIWYAQTLQEDVKRRDFTVNALAQDKEGRIYDYVGGVKDISKKTLRAVGDASVRFQEDALRLFRLCRFAGKLDFTVHKETQRAMPTAFERVKGLSAERVVAEIERLLVTPAAYKGLDILVRSGLGDMTCRRRENGRYTDVPILPECTHLQYTPQSYPYHVFDAWVHTLAVIAHTPPDLTLRYAALFHDVAKGLEGVRGTKDGRYTDYGHERVGADMTAAVLRRWQCNGKLINRVVWLVKTHMQYHALSASPEANVRRWLRREGTRGDFSRNTDLAEAVRQATVLSVADAKGCRPDSDTTGIESFGEYVQLLVQTLPITTKDLNYPPELPKLCGSYTGDCLRVLLKRVQDGALENDSAVLYEASRRWLKRQLQIREEEHG